MTSDCHDDVFPLRRLGDSDPRTLVLCFEGTEAAGHNSEEFPSNVQKFFDLLFKDDRDRQVVYYQPGIGSKQGLRVISELREPKTNSESGAPAIVRTLKQLQAGNSKLKKTILALDRMFAFNLDIHIQDGYRWLMQQYKSDDKICLFGFSRGAYIARALAGMLHTVGLLPQGNESQITKAYRVYTQPEWTPLKEIMKISITVNIEFIGVWDTVSSVGIVPRSLPFTGSCGATLTFRHALALDERRARFKAKHYRSTGDGKKDVEEDVKEVWFAGCHSDVGGGSEVNPSLSPISLRWMVLECIAKDTGILFKKSSLGDIGLDFDPQASVHRVRLCQENDDALVPICDQLRRQLGWWFVEFLPLIQEPTAETQLKKYTSIKWNLGRGRRIPPPADTAKVFVHNTVRTRIDHTPADSRPKYKPKAVNWEKLHTNLEVVEFVDELQGGAGAGPC